MRRFIWSSLMVLHMTLHWYEGFEGLYIGLKQAPRLGMRRWIPSCLLHSSFGVILTLQFTFSIMDVTY